MRSLFILIVFLANISLTAKAQELRASADTIALAAIPDSLAEATIPDTLPTVTRKPVLKRVNSWLDRLLRSWSAYDTTYIEPQRYNFTVMAQHTQIYQYSHIKLASGYSLTLSPDVVFKLGPYFGWRWIFLGYTIDVKNLFKNNDGTYFDLSIYSNKIGVDLYYIDNGSNYKLRHLRAGNGIDTSPLNGMTMSGFSNVARGFNLYYIINNNHFSYPAAFNQSTRQLRSAGSALVGLGYASHTYGFDLNRFFNDLQKIPDTGDVIEALENDMRNNINLKQIEYNSYTLSGGYGYNWVVAPCFLLAGSLSAGLSYNVIDGHYNFSSWMKNISTKNLSIDLSSRIGFVYNNSRWFAGLSAIMHNYNYRSDDFNTRSLYGTLNIYCGYNFDIHLKKKKK